MNVSIDFICGVECVASVFAGVQSVGMRRGADGTTGSLFCQHAHRETGKRQYACCLQVPLFCFYIFMIKQAPTFTMCTDQQAIGAHSEPPTSL